jgi:hypothetical protein
MGALRVRHLVTTPESFCANANQQIVDPLPSRLGSPEGLHLSATPTQTGSDVDANDHFAMKAISPNVWFLVELSVILVIVIPPISGLSKMNKQSFFTSIVTSLAVGLVCVMSAFTQTKRVPVIVMNTSSVFFQPIIKGAQDAASRAHGVTVIPIGSTVSTSQAFFHE